MSKLYRLLIFPNWEERFPDVSIASQNQIQIMCVVFLIVIVIQKQTPLRSENMWPMEEGFVDLAKGVGYLLSSELSEF